MCLGHQDRQSGRRRCTAWSISTANRTVEISYRDRKPENIKEASTKALNIEMFVNGRYSVQSTSDLRKSALQDFIANAVAATRLLAEDPLRTLPDPKYYQGAGRASTWS